MARIDKREYNKLPNLQGKCMGPTDSKDKFEGQKKATRSPVEKHLGSFKSSLRPPEPQKAVQCELR